jgi:hypothetical protein
VDLTDQDLVLELVARDGRRRRLSHTADAPCRYADLYAGGGCPWCEAERRRGVPPQPAPSPAASGV